MKDLSVGQIVRSKAGRDKTQYFVVVRIEQSRAMVADGKRHLLATPKPKNLAHLAKTNTILPAAALSNDQKLKQAVEAFEQTTCPTGTEEDMKLV